MVTMLDPYHFTGDSDEEPVLVGDEVPSGPTTPWDHFLTVAFPDQPLREHYGPGPHKSGSTQDSHAKGGVERASTKVLADIEAQGGTSLRTSGVVPTTGIMVSYPPAAGHSAVIDMSAPKATIRARVAEFVQKQRDFVTDHADRYIGGWVDAGKLYLDVSRNFPPERRAAAIAAGRRNNQIAVFDLDTFSDIPTGGTGT